MKRLTVAAVLFAFCLPLLRADFAQVLERAEALNDAEEYQQCRSFLEASLGEASGGRQKAEIHWRLARDLLNLGDEAEDRGVKGSELLAFFEQGEAQAQLAIEADPTNHLGYYWKSANIGRWGQVKGILNSLAKARPMRDLLQQALQVEPEHADSYYVLGQLYEQVPGGIISFGNKDYAVSLGRKAVDLHAMQVQAGLEKKLNYDYYTELAKHLWERNFTAARRLKDQEKKLASYRAASDPMEKNLYYEGTVSLGNISDRQEARELIQWTIQQLQRLPGRSGSEEDDLQEATETLAGWE
jgi:tetratricopeptide (TPR) repeat protein